MAGSLIPTSFIATNDSSTGQSGQPCGIISLKLTDSEVVYYNKKPTFYNYISANTHFSMIYTFGGMDDSLVKIE